MVYKSETELNYGI